MSKPPHQRPFKKDMICKITGCTAVVQNRYFCNAHWKQIPLKLRDEFWKQTDFGKQKPEPELLARINAVVKS
jgi:hypothetical protein